MEVRISLHCLCFLCWMAAARCCDGVPVYREAPLVLKARVQAVSERDVRGAGAYRVLGPDTLLPDETTL